VLGCLLLLQLRNLLFHLLHLHLQCAQLPLRLLQLLLIRTMLRAQRHQHVSHLRLQERAHEPALQGLKPGALLTLSSISPCTCPCSSNSCICCCICCGGFR
jgi:hypothetical protein